MKKILYIFTMIVASIVMNDLYSKEIYKLNNNWKFGSDMANSSSYFEINIPHVWESNNINKGKYTRELFAPISWANKSIYIKFNGVASGAKLFINNRFVGSHKGAYTAFTFDISPFMEYGAQNFITLEVNNFVDFDVLPLENKYYNYGGITRDIELIVANTEHISLNSFGSDGVYVKQKHISKDLAIFDIIIDVNAMAGDSLKVSASVYGDDFLVQQKMQKVNIEFDGVGRAVIPFEIKKPNLWNGKDDPYLYSVKVEAYNNKNNISDQLTTTFGLRSIRVDPKEGFFLNGEPYPLYGVNITSDKFGAKNGYTRYDIEKDFEFLLDLGLTAVRTTPGPLNKYFYELCDRHGILVWCDFPFTSDIEHQGKGFVNSFTFTSNGEMQMNEMLHQYNNHPSIVMYGIYNSISTRGDNPISFIDKLNKMAKSFSPDRYTVATSIEDGQINYITDLVGWGQYFGWKAHQLHDFDIWVNGLKSNWLDLSPAVAGFGAEAVSQHSLYNPSLYRKGATSISESGQNKFHETYINTLNKENRFWGYFVNSFADYRCSIRNIDGNSTYLYYGLINYDRSIKKDAYFLYRANWNKTDRFVHVAAKRATYSDDSHNQITIYSNCETVELKVNGISLGTRNPQNGIAKWSNVTLLNKENTIKAIGDKRYNDEIHIVPENYL